MLSALGQWGVHAACLWPGWVLACAAPAGLRLLGPRHRTRGEGVLGREDTGQGRSNRPDWGSRSGSDGWIGVAGQWSGAQEGRTGARAAEPGGRQAGASAKEGASRPANGQ